ncbi:MAG TPA: hypothetical protein VII13_10270 [Vicinamibacteria bacterium]|jgi:hypothetical protein
MLLLPASGAAAEAVAPCIDPFPQPAESPAAAPPGVAADELMRRPITEQELRDAIRFLVDLRADPGSGGPGRPRRLPDARLGVVLGDVMAVLVDLQASEVKKEIDEQALTPAGRDWYYAAIDALHRCAERRFAGRGELEAYTRTRGLVEAFRAALEDIALDMVRMPRPGTPRPNPWRDTP